MPDTVADEGTPPPRPADHNFGNTASINLTYRSLPDEVRTGVVRPLATSLVFNLDRVASLWSLPVNSVYWGSVFGQLHNAAFAGLYGIGTPDPAGSLVIVIPSLEGDPTSVRVDRIINLSTLSAQERLRFHHVLGVLWNSWFLAANPLPEQQLNNSAWTLGSNYLRDLAKIPNISEGLAAILANVILGVWTAFETLAADLWVAAVNAHPSGLATLTGASTRIEKRAGGGLSEGMDSHSGGQSLDKQISLDDIVRLTRGSFDIRSCVGELIRRRFKFTTLAGIREAYSVAFSHTEKKARTDKLDAALADKSLDALCAIRNLIVHKAGVADLQYIESSNFAPLVPKLTLGQRFIPDGGEVVALTGSVIMCCTNLTKAVDTWLTLTGANDAREPADARPDGA